MSGGWLGWEWGDVPAWVGSVLTGSSLAIAAVAYVRNAQERRRQNADKARTQAALVSSWPVNPRRWQVRNGNNVAVSVQALLGGVPVSEQVVLAPGESRGLRVPADRDVGTTFLPLLIVDSFGRSWLRSGTGDLVDVSVKGSVRSLPPSQADPRELLTWEERS